MAEIIHANFSESQRMELRALIRLASEIIAYYWPMRTFVHHNPLHGLEGLHFALILLPAEFKRSTSMPR